MRVVALALVLLSACAGAPGPAPAVEAALSETASPVPEGSTQLVTVVTSSWTATEGTLRRWTRVPGEGWHAVGEAVPVVVGRSGLGWGIGLHDASTADLNDPAKAEGDGRAPAGAFRLDRAFGYAGAEPTGLDYLAATPSTVCIDDAAAPRYNAVYDAGRDPADLGVSLERMRRPDALYRLGVIVDHNGGGRESVAPTPGAGSCIFLHVWRGPGSVTAGCTAMPDAALAEALAWLDAEAQPTLVQLPADGYARLADVWGLPMP